MTEGQQSGEGQQQQQQGQQQGQQQQQAPWYAARNDAEFTGTLQTRGLDKKTPDEVAFEFYKAHRESTGMISRLTGTPDKERIIIQPKPDAPQAEKDAYYTRLGRPTKADEYDFKDIKFPGGEELSDDITAMLRGAAFKANASKEQATTMARDLVAWMAKADEAEVAETASKYNAEKAELLRNWGSNTDSNLFIARNGMAKLGFSAEAIQAMEKAAGFKAIMEGALKAGIAFGEDRFVANRTAGTQGVMTRDQAKARMAELKMDRDWTARLMKGDRQATDEFNALTAMMVGQAA